MQLGHEADHTSPSSAEVKNKWSCIPLPHISSWLSAQLNKHRDNFTGAKFKE
jgi:hypothetical protein